MMRLTNTSASVKKAGIGAFMAAAASFGCSEMHPVSYPSELSPPQKEADALTLGIERTEKPERLSAKVIDTSLSIREYKGFCWLFYSGAGEGSMLLNPDAGSGGPEFIGMALRGSVVRVRQSAAGWDIVLGDGGMPEVLYHLQPDGTHPRTDSLFLKNSDAVCRKTREPNASAYGKDLHVSVVPLESR